MFVLTVKVLGNIPRNAQHVQFQEETMHLYRFPSIQLSLIITIKLHADLG